MIIDQIRNSGQYACLGAGFAQGLAYLQQTDFSALAAGRYALDGDRLYALVQDYDSRPAAQGRWEAHRLYADIQYVLAGQECIGYADTATLAAQPYDAEKDVLFLDGSGNMLTLKPGMFMILLPQDAHMPCLAVDAPEPVRKVVVKVRL